MLDGQRISTTEEKYEQAKKLICHAIFPSCEFKVALNSVLIPHWIAGYECFWYERETHIGREFRWVNANDKSNKPAFDHIDLASSLAEVVGQEINPDNLSISQLDFSLDPWVLTFTAFQKRWSFDGRKCESGGGSGRGHGER